MRIKKVCLYRMRVYSLLPGIIITPEPHGFRIAFKFACGHFGLWFDWTPEQHTSCNPYSVPFVRAGVNENPAHKSPLPR